MTRYYHNAKNKSRLCVFIAFFLAGFWLLHSCEEPPSIIGNKILPDSDYISIYSVDTFTVTSTTNYDSKIRTDALTTPFVGVYHDPYFGTTTSGYVTQLRLEYDFRELSEKWEMKTGQWDVDSVILVLRVTSSYGSNDMLKHYLKISEVSEKLYNNTDSIYYSDKSVGLTGFEVSSILPPFRTDTISVIRMSLPKSFGRYLIRQDSMLFYTLEKDKEDFRDYFKGIYITMPSASASDPFLLGFDFNYDSSVGYYQNYFEIHLRDLESPKDVTSFLLLLDSKKENARFTTIKHDFSGTALANVAAQPVTDSLSYVQGVYGAYTTISIPGLETIKNDPERTRTAINKARLIVPLDTIYTKKNVASQNLLMRYVNKSGDKEIVPDYSVVDDYGQSYFSGVLDTAKCEYHFNISNFVQNYFKDTQNILKPEVEIFLPASSVPNAILKTNDSKTPPKFELTLTDY